MAKIISEESFEATVVPFTFKVVNIHKAKTEKEPKSFVTGWVKLENKQHYVSIPLDLVVLERVKE